MSEHTELNPKVDERPINLTQALKLAGCVASGGAAKALIAAGLVQVNGEVELRKRCKLKPGDTIVIRDGPTIVVISGSAAQ
jgi:ribosome-associated protein